MDSNAASATKSPARNSPRQYGVFRTLQTSGQQVLPRISISTHLYNINKKRTFFCKHMTKNKKTTFLLPKIVTFYQKKELFLYNTWQKTKNQLFSCQKLSLLSKKELFLYHTWQKAKKFTKNNFFLTKKCHFFLSKKLFYVNYLWKGIILFEKRDVYYGARCYRWKS